MRGSRALVGKMPALETVARPESRTPPTKELLGELFSETLACLSLRRLIPQKVLCWRGVLHVGGEQINLRLFERVIVIAFGKAAYQMTESVAAVVQPITLSGVIIVTGGEYSCPVNGDGVGGRNQAFVLDCVPRIAGKNIAVLSAGTDGIDGTSPAAGAVADGGTFARARQLGLDPGVYSQRADSHGFFSKLGDALMTGPTGNNVRELRILVGWS